MLVYIEPTPYIIGLIKCIFTIFPGRVDVLFLKENLSQNWNIKLTEYGQLIPQGKLNRIFFFLRLLKKNRYHIVHMAGWIEPIFIFLLFLSKLLGIPVSIESDTPMPHATKYWKRMVKRLFYPRLFKWINLFLAGGKRQIKYLEYFGISLKRIISMQMTVDVATIQKDVKTFSLKDKTEFRQKLHIPEEDIVFLYVGRLEQYKGIVDLITAFEAISSNNLSLLFVGDGSLREVIEQKRDQNKKIIFTGRLSNLELIQAYYSSDVVVLPSHFEPWGLVINEAMATGKPVIVSERVGCVDDLVTPETGIIVQAEKPENLQQAILSLASSAELRASMGKNAEQVIANWTLENEAEIVCNAWNQLIKA